MLFDISPREAMDDFLINLRGTQRKAATIQYYRSSLRAFIAFCEQQNLLYLSLPTFNARLVRRYFAYREEEAHVNRTTLYHDFCVLRKFVAFCRQERYLEGNPMGELAFKKPRPRPVECPDDQEVERFMRAVRERWDPKKNPKARYTHETYRVRIARRDYCLILALYETGARRSEIVSLLHDDVLDAETKFPALRFRDTKTGEDRIVPVSPQWIEALRAYLRVRPKSSCPSLFLGEYDEPLSAAWFGKKFKAYATFAGLPHLTPQWLRRYRANRLVNSNHGDTESAALLLGNSPAVLRMHYLQRNPERLREVWERSLQNPAIMSKRTRRRL